MDKLSGETKLFIGIIVATVFIIGGATFFFTKQQNTPPLTREQLIPPGTAITGNASASAFLVEFSDFQCPACKVYEPIIKRLITTHGEKITFAYRHFPLTQHPYAQKAAQAAIAAGKQNKFWEMHAELFTNQETLSDQTVETIVKKLELNTEEFKTAVTDPKTQETIQNDIMAGNQFGVDATPTFFLNGKKLRLSSAQDLYTTVEAAIK